MQTNYLTPLIDKSVNYIQEREMALPLLLFVAAHRPLAFVAGQFLHVASPLAQLGGWRQCADWANLLSSPAGIDQLVQLLQSTKSFEKQL
ncbi:MAG: hypothetical protein R2911_00800 [Caldilineaceae bacterium]